MYWLLTLLFFPVIFSESSIAGSSVTPLEFAGKNYVGYQAWFNTPKDGSHRGWTHWGTTSPLNSNKMTIDLWPDVAEYSTDALENTGFVLGNGTPAKTFSSYPQSVVNLHFSWMKTYNIDGAFLQWFITEPGQYRLEIAKRVRIAADKYNRQFTIMFDISGSSSTESCSTGSKLIACIQNRWIAVVDAGLTQSSNYIRHKGLPLVSIWGLGFTHNSNLTAFDAIHLTNWFKYHSNSKYRASVMGGVSTHWRTLNGDSLSDANWVYAYANLDIISPWSVGRYSNENEAVNFIRNQYTQDINLIASRNQGFLPVIFAGFSWFNLSRQSPSLPDAPLNQIPRQGGQFIWAQARELSRLGLSSTYTAMFDEVDEGTAIFKTAATSDKAPGEFQSLKLNADGLPLPSDWYLQVSKNISSALKSIGLSGFAPSRLPLLTQHESFIIPRQSSIRAGSAISNNFLRLVYQYDGNLVIYNYKNQALWASDTAGRTCTSSTCLAAYQNDGNIVLYQNGHPYWASNVYAPQSTLKISMHFPNISILNINQIAIWQGAWNTNQQLQFSSGGLLLYPNDLSQNANVKIIFQSNGNLVVYNSLGAVLWASDTWGRDCSKNCLAAFQHDGNLVLYQNGVPYWASHTINPNYKLRIFDHAPYLSTGF
jgi:hypothetical protein